MKWFYQCKCADYEKFLSHILIDVYIPYNTYNKFYDNNSRQWTVFISKAQQIL